MKSGNKPIQENPKERTENHIRRIEWDRLYYVKFKTDSDRIKTFVTQLEELFHTQAGQGDRLFWFYDQFQDRTDFQICIQSDAGVPVKDFIDNWDYVKYSDYNTEQLRTEEVKDLVCYLTHSKEVQNWDKNFIQK